MPRTKNTCKQKLISLPSLNINTMKKFFTNIGMFIWIGIIWLISTLAIFIDRVIMLPVLWRDLPSAQMINEFDHEKERLAKRWAIYISIAVVFGIFWFGSTIIAIVYEYITLW